MEPITAHTARLRLLAHLRHHPAAADTARPRGVSAPGAQTATADRRELDARTADGLHIRLLWDPVADRVAVTVADPRTGLELEVPVRDGERPLDVFHHPLAYAAHHGIEPRPTGAPFGHERW